MRGFLSLLKVYEELSTRGQGKRERERLAHACCLQ